MSEVRSNQENTQPSIDNDQQAEQQSWFSSKIYKFILIYIIFSIVLNFFRQADKSNDFKFKNILDKNKKFNVNFYLLEGKSPVSKNQVLKKTSPIMSFENLTYFPEGNSSFFIEKEMS